MLDAINDCFRILGIILDYRIVVGVPLSLTWPLLVILCTARIFHFIALER